LGVVMIQRRNSENKEKVLKVISLFGCER